MTEAELVSQWFTPFHYFVYLGTLFVLLVTFYQWKWTRTAKNSILVLVAQQGGGGNFSLAPKTGGSVSIKNPDTGLTRTWPVNELSTIDVLYPGVGFVPAFMQKTIRMAIVSEGDWEPLLNRSSHKLKVASPDMVKALTEIASNASVPTQRALTKLLDGVATAPTREMIASPAVLGNLMEEKVSQLAVTVAKDIVNPLQEAIKKMGQRVNPNIVYIGLGLILGMLGFSLIQGLPALESISAMVADIAKIQQALGITGGP